MPPLHGWREMLLETEVRSHAAFYGLPAEVRFCARCVISNQRPCSVVEFRNTPGQAKPTIHFDSEGVCSACRFAEMKAGIDWRERERQLVELCRLHRSRTGAYDCIVPGSGGKDSAFTAHILKHKYGMNPLTVTWAPHAYTSVGWGNFQNWIGSGLDNILVTPNCARAPSADAAGLREPGTSVSALHHRPETGGAAALRAVRHSAHLLRREPGRIRQQH